MDKKLQKSLTTDSVNQELLKSILDFGVEESKANNELIKELIKGENSPLLANFNPNNHFDQEQQVHVGTSVFLISQMAIQDIELIWTQTHKNVSIKDADDLKALLIISLNTIAKNFTCGKSIENVRDGYHFLNVEHYCIYYRADLPDTVEVIRVLC